MLAWRQRGSWIRPSSSSSHQEVRSSMRARRLTTLPFMLALQVPCPEHTTCAPAQPHLAIGRWDPCSGESPPPARVLRQQVQHILEEKEQEKLIDELKKLNNFLGSVNSPGIFLNGDEMQHPDCDILPKLQHVKVALKKYKNFDIPEYLPNLKAYMKSAQEHPSFSSACPCDEAIIEGWRKHFI